MKLPNVNLPTNPAEQDSENQIDADRGLLKENTEILNKLNDNLKNISSVGKNFQTGVYDASGNNTFAAYGAKGIPSMLTDFIDTVRGDENKNQPSKLYFDEVFKELKNIDKKISEAFGAAIKEVFAEKSQMTFVANNYNKNSENGFDVLSGIIDRLESVFGQSEKKSKTQYARTKSTMFAEPIEIDAKVLPLNSRSKKNSVRLDDIQYASEKNYNKVEKIIENKNSQKDLVVFENNKYSTANPAVNTTMFAEPIKINPNALNKNVDLADSTSKPSMVNVKSYNPILSKESQQIRNTNTSKINTDNSNTIINAVLKLLTKTNRTDKQDTADVRIVGKALDVLIGIEKSITDVNRPKTEGEFSSKQLEKDQSSNRNAEMSVEKTTIKKQQTQETTDDIRAAEPNKSSLLGSAIDAAQGIAGAAMVAGGAKKVLGKVGKIVGKGAGLGTISAMGLDFVADAVGKTTKSGAILDVASDVAGMASTGALIGSVVPGIGTAVGATGGAVIGGVTGLYKNIDTIFGKSPKQKMEYAATEKSPIFEESVNELEKINKQSEQKMYAREDSANKVIASTVKNNNIFPTRQSTKNDDFSFNRYLDKSFS